MKRLTPRGIHAILIGVFLVGTLAVSLPALGGETGPAKNLALRGKVFASSRWRGFPAVGAVDGHRFSTGRGKYWCGAKNEKTWGWGIDFGEPRKVGRIYQVMGSDASARQYAPTDYVWQCSGDGRDWRDVPGTSVTGETRIFRILTFDEPTVARFFRIRITATVDAAPSLREVEMYADPGADVGAAPWFYAVEIGASGKLPGNAKPFLSMAPRCPGWEGIQAQVVRVVDFREAILETAPRPLCAFIGGSKRDWCERRPEDFQGLEEVLKGRNLPLWGSCGGGQILPILEVYGTKAPWICPHCEWNRPERYEKTQKPFIYGHIRCKGKPKCGEYPCRWEKGIFPIVPVFPDPAFRYLPSPFHLYENHVGEIRWIPKDWIRVATRGSGGTGQEILRVGNRYIYAVQAHVESSGRDGLILMKNFLDLARSFGGYNPEGKDVPHPGKREDRAGDHPSSDGFAGVWWMDTEGVRKGHWNGVVTLHRVGNLVGGYYLNSNGVGTYVGTCGARGSVEGEIWWEQKGKKDLWRFRYEVSLDGRALLGGSRGETDGTFKAENGLRIETGPSRETIPPLPAKGLMDRNGFGLFSGYWRTESDRVREGVHDPLVRLKHRGNVVWGWYRNRATGGFGLLLGVVVEKGEFVGRGWWREKGNTAAFSVNFTLDESAMVFQGRYRPDGGDWKPWNGIAAN